MKETILETIEQRISMPSKIVVGDPSYFDDFSGAKLDRLVFNKGFRGKKDWYVKAFAIKTKMVFTKEEDGFSSTDEGILIKLIAAPDERLFNLYNSGQCLTSMKVSTMDLGCDTASYIFEINGHGDTINTGADGYYGQVTQFHVKSKLVGFILEVGLEPDVIISEASSFLNYITTGIRIED